MGENEVTYVESWKSWNSTLAPSSTRADTGWCDAGGEIRVDPAQRVQNCVYDTVAEQLARHPCKPWIAHGASRRDRIVKWLSKEHRTRPEWQSEAAAVLRGAARDAFEATQRWDEHQQELAKTVRREREGEEGIRRAEASHPNTIENGDERKEHEPSPRLVKRGTNGASSTRRREERAAALRVLQPVKVAHATTVSLPGIRNLELEDPVPDGADVR